MELMQSIQIALQNVKQHKPTIEQTLKTNTSQNFVPELDAYECPLVMALKSVHDTTIEGFWHWLYEKIGHNIKAHLLQGQEGHHYNVAVPWHQSALF